MKWSIATFKIIYRILNIGIFFILLSTQAHIAPLQSNTDLYKIYSLDHNPTKLLYHFESGTVQKQDSNGLQNVYRHAHITDKIPVHAKTLGYINTSKNNSSTQQQYVYIEPNKPR